MSSNCTVTPPVSQVYFSELPLAEEIAVGICGALCLGVIALFIDKAYFLINHYQPSNPEIKIKSLWLVGIYPVFAVAALLAILVPRAALLCDLVSTVYLAVCLVHFNALIILYSDGAQQLLEKVAKTGFSLRTPPCCCCCFCCPPISASRSNLQRLWFMVLQTSFLQPFISFVTLVLWLDEKYVRGQVSFTEAYLYLSIVNAASTLVAMYGLLVLFRSVRAFLRTHSITQKFVVLQLVLLFHNLQGFIFVTLAKYNIPTCLGSLSSDVRSYAIQHMIVVGEMFLLAVMARVLYRRPHRMSSDLESEDTSVYADEDGASGIENCWTSQNQESSHRNGYQVLSSRENQEHSPP